MEEENNLNDELPIPWLDEDLNLPTTFISSANESATVVLKDAEDLDDLIQSKKTEYQLGEMPRLWRDDDCSEITM
jgi:hypothetical protein